MSEGIRHRTGLTRRRCCSQDMRSHPFLDWPSERGLALAEVRRGRLGVSGEHLPLPAEDLVDKDDRIWVIGDDAGLSALVEQCMTRLH